jgi:hypothetical protein
MGLLDILNQVMASGQANDKHIDQVTQDAPQDVLASGLAHTFRSDQTPDIGAMVGQLFGNSNGTQQAGVLNQIVAALGPAAASALAGGLLGKMMSGAGAQGGGQISAAQASQLSPQQVNDIVADAHQKDPGIADALGDFYAQHSGLIKTLGGAALVVAMAKMKERMTQA